MWLFIFLIASKIQFKENVIIHMLVFTFSPKPVVTEYKSILDDIPVEYYKIV